MFDERLTRRQSHDHWDTPIISCDGNRHILEHSIYECSHLRNKAFGIAFDEEIEREIASHAAGIADDSSVRVIVSGRDSPRTAQLFHPLVIAIDGMAAVADRTDYAVGKLQHDNCIV